ncbi:right-handed parallel beta-helix repeat-containing protein [Pseudomaricurvus sp. HS19]|uniref:right-handed parallel beta-helix repeat-containing protein n=1 Tax=Pseudomaricurvus sp. HS19 TaxID=2692626 RepID=UPI00137184F8|nr:right-handed parallel beta-helix repeat-containing protein [Pseudomaricurvus sp. HS19]MYM63544.1 hypothetical protein [Pseudomaricurvus sp. HS19]
MQKVIRLVVLYFALAGLVAHLSALTVYLFFPGVIYKVQERMVERFNDSFPMLAAMAGTIPVEYDLESELQQVLPPWQPQAGTPMSPGEIRIGTRLFPNLQEAVKALRDGDTLMIGPGIYEEAFLLTASNTRIIGNGAVHIRNKATGGKGAMVIRGHNTLIRNIECSGISVSDRNGACVRLEGKNIILDHVYFHDSDQGLLTGYTPGIMRIHDSRFVKLGRGGRAHGVYVGGGELYISNSIFAAARGSGHEIKSRAAVNEIRNSLLTSLSSDDSRLVDISNGGKLVITDSVLHQGPGTTNGDVIGFALEDNKRNNQLQITNNLFILERDGPNYLLHTRQKYDLSNVRGNVIVGRDASGSSEGSITFPDRKKAGIGDYPALPDRTDASADTSGLQWQ